jgi:hypothetical protein
MWRVSISITSNGSWGPYVHLETRDATHMRIIGFLWFQFCLTYEKATGD